MLFFYLCSICVTRMRKEWFFVCSVCRRWSRSQKNKSPKPLCLRKNKKTEYFYISILTSVSLAAFNPTIRAFRSEISKHLPAKPEFFGMFQDGLKRVLLNKCTFLKPHYSCSVILN